MWAQYRKLLIPTQLFIVAFCAAMSYYSKPVNWPAVILTFIVMQVFAVGGAWWGSRLRGRIDRTAGELPLKRRR